MLAIMTAINYSCRSFIPSLEQINNILTICLPCFYRKGLRNVNLSSSKQGSNRPATSHPGFSQLEVFSPIFNRRFIDRKPVRFSLIRAERCPSLVQALNLLKYFRQAQRCRPTVPGINLAGSRNLLSRKFYYRISYPYTSRYFCMLLGNCMLFV